MHKQKLVIIGASGHGKVVADIALMTEKYQQIFFLDDKIIQQNVMGIPVIGGCERVEEMMQKADFFVAVGNTEVRRRLLEDLIQKGANIATLIHPNAVIGRGVEIGIGSVIMAGAVLNAECRVGRGCIVNTCASVDHECLLGDYVHISIGAHLAGTVKVGDGTWIGAGAIVNNNVIVTESCVIGAGTVVIKDINEMGTYVGVPARKLMKEEKCCL